MRRTYLENIYDYLVKRKYFKMVRQLLEEKVPPLYDVVLSPPNSMSETLLQMIQHPLRLLMAAEPILAQSNQVDNVIGTVVSQNCATLILSSFVEEILVPEYTPPIQLFILPCIANNMEFPFFHLLQYLSDLIVDDCMLSAHQSGEQPPIAEYQTSQDHFADDSQQTDAIDKLFSSSFLLKSLLTLDQLHFERMHANIGFVRRYIKILGKLSNNIRKLPHRLQSVSVFRQSDVGVDREDDDDDSDNEDSQRITSGNDSISPMERECLLEVIYLLNEDKRAHLIVDHYENYLDNFEVLHSLCRICHNFMLYHRSAIFEYR